MLIYIVEDDADSRDKLTRMLRVQHHEVVTFSNANDTTDYIALHGTPDVALIDLKLEAWPNGINLARTMRLMHPNTAIVMISAFATPKDVAIAFRHGADDFLIRPVEQDELLNSLSEAALNHRPFARLEVSNGSVDALTIDADMRKVYWHNVELQLTPTEFGVITQLSARPRVVMNFAQLYSVINGEHLSSKEARKRLKSHISNLKQKLREAAPGIDLPLRTSWGHGVYWDAENYLVGNEWDDPVNQ
jgi:two-component system alkaline phosphatase synthesis response regulator PhoP